uniref:Uncharacterized protein n=1 Tax=Panagrolaimus davidi TaxID=227884 RepID=A0A914PT98_9BILA
MRILIFCLLLLILVDFNKAQNSTDERTENIKRLFRETFKILATAPPPTKSPTTSLKPKTTTTITAESITSTIAIKPTTTTTLPTTTATTERPTTKPPPTTTTTLTTEIPVEVYRASDIIMDSRPPPRRIPSYTPMSPEIDYPETPYRGDDSEILYGDQNPEEIPSAHIPVESDHYEVCGNAGQSKSK